MSLDKLLDEIIRQALAEAQAKQVTIYTFALYFDHESRALSVCIDTEEKSARTVNQTNAYNNKHFLAAVADGNLAGATMWGSNIGRSLSLGDFELVNLARTDVEEEDIPEQFFLLMVQSVVRNQTAIARHSVEKERLILCCSGPNEEVGFVWSGIDARH